MPDKDENKYFVWMAVGLVGVIGLFVYLIYKESKKPTNVQLNPMRNELRNEVIKINDTNIIEPLKLQYDSEINLLKNETDELRNELKLTQEQILNILRLKSNTPKSPAAPFKKMSVDESKSLYDKFGMS
jgi:hypothetical protein